MILTMNALHFNRQTRKPANFFFLLLLTTLLWGCQPANPTDTSAATPAKTAADSLYDQVIALHDEAMPKMGKLMGYKKAAQQKIDSLGLLIKQNNQTTLAGAKAEYDALLQQLTTAEKSMNDWMDEFDPDPKFLSQDSVKAYFAQQKATALSMKNAVFAAVDSAKAKLGQ